VGKYLELDVPGNMGSTRGRVTRSARGRGDMRGRGNTGREVESVTQGFAEVSKPRETRILPPNLDKSLLQDRSQLATRTRGRAAGTIGTHLQTTEGAVESVGGDFAGGAMNTEVPLLPAVDMSTGLDASENRGRRSARRQKPAERPILPNLDKSLMPDTSQLGEMNRQNAPEAMSGNQQTIERVSWGFAATGTPTLPNPEKYFMPDASQLGRRNRQIAPKTMGGYQQKTENTARGFAEAPILSAPDKSLIPDASQLGKRNTRRGRETMGGHLQTSESAAGGFAEAPMPPTLDKSLMPDASKLGKRKREKAPEIVRTHPRADEGAAEGLTGAEASLPSTLGAPFQLDASQIPIRGRGRGSGRKCARLN
ncbi:hypothetical protein V491_09100, partial [Pseudogymnoascus sp. VKM F-3775]